MWQEIPPFRTKTIRLEEGDLFTFTVDSQELPVDWPNLYCVAHLRPTSMALRTMETHMEAVCRLHNWAATQGIDLRRRIESFDLFSREEIKALRFELRANLEHRKRQAQGLQPKGKSVVSSSVWKSRCQAVRDYVQFHAENALSRMSSRDSRLAEARQRQADFRTAIVGHIKIHRRATREGLSEEVREIFLRAITPGDPSNPFAAWHQERNYALWLLYYDGGLRKSEALGLKGEDLQLHGKEPMVIVHRRPDDRHDPRKRQPRTKTLAHPVPLTPRLARALYNYMIGSRRNILGAKKSPYVFLSQESKPLSGSTVTYMCEQLREKVPGIPANFVTHVLRHTWNDRFGDGAEELALPEGLEQHARNQSQGWTRTSEQGSHYQRRRIRKRAQKVILKMQDAATREGSK
jgi:integrase